MSHTSWCSEWEGRSCDCQVSQHAQIGGPPEHRNHQATDRSYAPHIGARTRINAFVTVDAGTARATRVGDDCFLLAHSHVAHDCIIGDRCELATGATLGGWVELGDDVHVGLNATIRPRIKVGAGARIGAGAVVVKDVPAGEVWVGNPAAPIDGRKVDPLWAEQFERGRAA